MGELPPLLLLLLRLTKVVGPHEHPLVRTYVGHLPGFLLLTL